MEGRMMLELPGLESLEGRGLVEVIGKKWREGKRGKHRDTITGK